MWCEAGGSHPHVDRTSQLVDCLSELGRLIQRDHSPTYVTAEQELQSAEKDDVDESTKRPVDGGVVSHNANDVLMFRTKLKSLAKNI